MTRPKRVCAFCGGSPVTVEHIFGRKWIERIVPGANAGFRQQLTIKRDEHSDFDRKQWIQSSGQGAGLIVKTVCRACNHGWMERLDHEAQPLLWQLAFAKTGTVACPAGNQLLAAWATKIALLIDTITSPPTVPAESRRAFYEHHNPLERTTVWIGAIEKTPTPARQTAATIRTDLAPDDGTYRLYVSTFHILHVIFQVVIPVHPDIISVRATMHGFVHRLWPPERMLRWPPTAWLKEEPDFELLAASVLAGYAPAT